MKQNITLNLDQELIQKARILAARRRTSVSRMLSRELEKIVLDAERYDQARRRAIAQLRTGWHLSGGVACSREELHER
ncbi:MAG: hypothetical protein HGB17_04790 [Syntrophobacteraceae bacterium]|nr:hypothetical protein [Syntrophobacteraceae bacterium]